MKSAVLIVEPDFLSQHVGVARVTRHYWKRLMKSGYRVSVGVADSGFLRVLPPTTTTLLMGVAPGAGSAAALWPPNANNHPRFRVVDSAHVDVLAVQTDWKSQEQSRASDFDLSIVTAPWVVAEYPLNGRSTYGIAHDLYPNLLAAQSVFLTTPTSAMFDFAHRHHQGYQYYRDSVGTVLAVSDFTRSQFALYYGGSESAVETSTPFDADPRVLVKPEGAREGALRVLLVNALDPRKNLEGIAKALVLVAQNQPLYVNVVGRERMDPTLVFSLLNMVADSGAHVVWHRSAADETLSQLYIDSDVLLFPSLHEGLGLPMLESQWRGLPAISSSNSALHEINFNSSLFVDENDPSDIATRIQQFASGELNVVSGKDLQNQTLAYLSARTHDFED